MVNGPVLVYAEMDEPSAAFVRSQLSDVPLEWVDKHAPAPDDEARFQACRVGFGNVPAGWLARHPGLEWLQLESVGFEYYRGVDWKSSHPGLRVSNLRGLFDDATAETAIAGLLHFVRGLQLLVPAQTQQSWQPLVVRPQTTLLSDSRVIILGAGNIGRCVRRRLEAFGCLVRSFARRSPEAELHALAELDEALPNTDILFGCLPNTPETAGLLNADRLALLPPRAYLVNVGRGTLIEETALLDRLTRGLLRGAVLDVTRQEPIPAGSPLWTCPRLLLTQHTAGGSAGELRAKAEFFVRNYRRYQRGEALLNGVELQQGY